MAHRRQWLAEDPRDAGVVHWSAYSRREPVESALGKTTHAADDDAYTDAVVFRESLPEGPIKASGEAAAYQVSVTSGTERFVQMPGSQRLAPVDAISAEYGARVVDAKHVRETGTSWNNPGSLDNTGARDAATKSMDRAILRAHDVSTSAGPDGSVQMITNSSEAASFIEGRMRALGVDGIVVLHPGRI